MEGRDSPGLTSAEGRRFGLTVGVAFVVLAGVVAWRGHGAVSASLAVVGGLLVAAGLVVPRRLGPIQRGWMALASLVSRVTTPIVMSALYLLVLTPAGLLRRTLGGNPVLDRGGRGDTQWKERPPSDRQSDLERQF